MNYLRQFINWIDDKLPIDKYKNKLFFFQFYYYYFFYSFLILSFYFLNSYSIFIIEKRVVNNTKYYILYNVHIITKYS